MPLSPRSRYFSTACVIVQLISFAVFAHAALTHSYGALAYGEDGGFHFVHAMKQWTWDPFALGLYLDPLRQLGTVSFPSITKLTPLYVIPDLLLNSGAKLQIEPTYVILAYTIGSLEFFLSCLVLVRSLRLSWPVAIIAAWALPLLVEPYFGQPLLFPILMLSPSMGSMIAQFCLLLASMNELGRQDSGLLTFRWRNWALGVIILLQTIILIAFFPAYTVIWAPVLAIIFVGLLLGAHKLERRIKLTVLSTIGIALLILGPAFFLLGLFMFAASNFFLVRDPVTDPIFISIWYGTGSTGPLGPKLFAVGIVGMVLTIFFDCRRLRSLALCTLFAVGLIVGLGLANIHWRFWRGPEPIYFEFLIWPLYIIFGVHGAVLLARQLSRATAMAICKAAGLIRRFRFFSRGTESNALAATVLALSIAAAVLGIARILPKWIAFITVGVLVAAFAARYLPSFFVDRARRISRLAGEVLMMLLAVPKPIVGAAVMLLLLPLLPAFAFFHLHSTSAIPRMFALPPSKPLMIASLEERIGLEPNELFRGRVAALVTLDSRRYTTTGNDYQQIGLWFHWVPSLFEYYWLMSPAYFRAVTHMFTNPNDPERPWPWINVARSHPDPHALGLLGVRFVIADAKLPPPFQSVMDESTFKDERLYLYELAKVNLGTSAPTNIKVVHNFDEALAEIGDQKFDWERSAVLFEGAPFPGNLVALNFAEIRMIPGGFSVAATSAGRSLMVIPFEFSRCFRLRAAASDQESQPVLMRVNALQTGLLFEKHVEAEIQYFTGLFSNATCRVQDARDFSKLLGPNKSSTSLGGAISR